MIRELDDFASPRPKSCVCLSVDGHDLHRHDDDHTDDLAHEARCTDQEVDYLLELMHAAFPTAQIVREDIVSSFAGVRLSHRARVSIPAGATQSLGVDASRRGHGQRR